MNDEELERRLRDADPSRAFAPIPAERQRATLERIMAETPAPARRSRAARVRAAWIAVPAALAALAVAAVAFLNPFTAPVAAAYGPAPLTYTAIDKSLAEVVAEAKARLADSPGPATTERRSDTVSWSLTLSSDGEAEPTVYIEPLEREFVWSEDLSATQIFRTGAPFLSSSGLPATPPNAKPPGTLIDELTWEPGTYSPATPGAEDLDAQFADDLLQLYIEYGSGFSGQALTAVPDLFSEFTMTNAQHADILQALLSVPDIDVLGVTTDREGREVIGVTAEAMGDQSATLLISTRTGRIVGYEMSVTGPGSPLPVPVGTVASYSLWPDTK